MTLPKALADAHLNTHEIPRPTPAKADLKKIDGRVLLGKVFARAVELAHLSRKEASGVLGRDEAQVSRWCAGTEMARIDLLLERPMFHGPVLQAFGELIGAAVQVTVSIKLPEAV